MSVSFMDAFVGTGVASEAAMPQSLSCEYERSGLQQMLQT